MTTDPTRAERVARYVAAAPARGLVRVSLWVPVENAHDIKRAAAEMRARHRDEPISGPEGSETSRRREVS